MDIQRITMLKTVALLVAVVILLLLVHRSEAAPVALQHKVSIPLAHAMTELQCIKCTC